MLNWLYRHPKKHGTDWIIRQLDLQPHQHLLEVGCGSGRLLAVVASKLNNSFLAGIEPSVALYRQARRNNRLLIRQETMQLHTGNLYDLPYPASYFHTIYGSGSHYSWNNLATECLRLSSLLRVGGRLVLLSQPGLYRKEEDLRTEAARWQAAFLKAGLTDIQTEYRGFSSGIFAAIKGFKPDRYADSEGLTGINNRLLNPEAYFISNVA
ncbi:MAG TPA: class I SAM-dependent methyltransferase, partial [Puia sp.]|nr:class I SAM-dependent methyltransferase [Puia sp.]